ncbi:MAG TPA: phosphoketolase family protein [Candidatus Acidoferrales bacterium]|nr:phosphoketolase family protein [Candidatus Acidoferrales bacterium]
MFVFDSKLSTAVESPIKGREAPPLSPTGPLSAELLAKMHRYWQAANYLTVGQIYLQENPLLWKELRPEHIKPRMLGHWGTSPGLSFIYVHLNRLIKEKDAEILYIAGPGHGGPALTANAYLEGTYSSVRAEITEDAAGMRLFFREFSMPGGVPSHCGPHVPNSIHEGGELGYALLHAFGAAFDNPDLIVACVVGDGEAETCPLEGSWKGNRFLNPVTDGAVLPILHLNGYKISGPTVEARTSDEEIEKLYEGRGYNPYFVEGDDPPRMHQEFARVLDQCYGEIREIQKGTRERGFSHRPCWPMIVLRTPKGWTGPKEVDGLPVEGTFRAHQVPIGAVRENPGHLRLLESWMRSYKPEELFDADGRFVSELRELAPAGNRRMGATPHANGGRLLTPLALPKFEDYALELPAPGRVMAEAPQKPGEFLRDIIKQNSNTFRFFCPDETNSNRLGAVFEVTDRSSVGETVSIDDHVSARGRVMEVLSEHCCQGWLEGYLLTGRHGLWASYEAFAQVVDSMLTQHAKWLEESERLPWRKPLASLNVFLTSHAWRNDHNGFSHQAPGFVDNALARRSAVIRIYYPPDANSLLSTFDHCLRSRNYVNIITCGKQEQLQWLTMEQAIAHCSRGASAWEFASNDGGNPDIVLACVGDVPTLETVAASWLLQKYVPEIKIRVVNIVDLAVLMSAEEHPHGMDNLSFCELFTETTPVLFAHHGYRWSIHSMIHGRPNEARFHVRGFIDEGTTTTPFDMVVRNKISRFHLALDALKYVPRVRSKSTDVTELFRRKLFDHNAYIREHFEDMPEIVQWRWTDDFREPPDHPA